MDQFGIMVGLSKKESFEGWFVKIDDQVNDLMISVIWGYTTNDSTKHAFIQFTSSIDHQTSYIRYPIEELKWQTDPFVLQIGKNQLSEKGMTLDFEYEGVNVKGKFEFGELTPIKKSFLRPNIMGWLTYFPNECNHSITSMHHRVNGNLKIGEAIWAFKQAHGYLEKDWGKSFPKEYVWVHANGWGNSSFVFSHATVPVLGKFAKGFFLVLQHEGKEYRFSSIEGARMLNFEVSKDAFKAKVKKGKYTITIEAKQNNPVSLASPIKGEMSEHIKESLDGTIEIMMKLKGKEIIRLSSNRASIDVHY
ncbi:MAG: tocopherol cyclase family protein [Clostridiaceae bacterium]